MCSEHAYDLLILLLVPFVVTVLLMWLLFCGSVRFSAATDDPFVLPDSRDGDTLFTHLALFCKEPDSRFLSLPIPYPPAAMDQVFGKAGERMDECGGVISQSTTG